MSIRNTLIAKVKIGCKQLNLTDDREAYEAMLHNLTRKRSCSKMSVKELQTVINHMTSRGAVFTNKNNKRRYRSAADPQVRMIFGMWTELYEMGRVSDPSREALRTWVRRMTKSDDFPDGVGDPDWLRGKQLIRCIESLKQWIAR